MKTLNVQIPREAIAVIATLVSVVMGFHVNVSSYKIHIVIDLSIEPTVCVQVSARLCFNFS